MEEYHTRYYTSYTQPSDVSHAYYVDVIIGLLLMYIMYWFIDVIIQTIIMYGGLIIVLTLMTNISPYKHNVRCYQRRY